MTTAEESPSKYGRTQGNHLPEQASEVQTEELALARIFFVLAEPISLPDGYHFVTSARNEGDPDARPDDPEISLIFHQVETAHGRASGTLGAVSRATRKAGGLPPQAEDVPPPELETQWTVVEAVTPWDSPDPIPSTVTHAGHRTPRSDVFMRCLYATRHVVRAYRQATETPYGLPTYVRTMPPVLVYTSSGIRETWHENGQPFVVLRPTQDVWSGPSAMLLDHWNLPDPCRGTEFTMEIDDRFKGWLRETSRGNPLHLWRERFIEARRAHIVTGEDPQSVILANTSCEVMLDAILALLMWEEGLTVEEAAPAFEEGKILRRVSRELQPRLKGNWSTKQGAVGDWYRAGYRLRHRVVNGGYSPTPGETADALSAALELQRFVMNRIAERRTTYSRTALMTLTEAGLRRRGMWSGKIRRFAEQALHDSPDWYGPYIIWYRELVASLSP